MQNKSLFGIAFFAKHRLAFLAILLGSLWFSFISATLPDHNPSGNLTAGEFKLYTGIRAILPDFDFDAKCSVTGYQLMYIPYHDDPVIIDNKGADFQTNVRDLVRRAKSGDVYVFTDIKAKCPGDSFNRTLEPLTVKIK